MRKVLIFSALVVSMALTSCSDNKQPQETNATPEDKDMLHVASPEWQDQIIYFLMIDRFNDAVPENNDMGKGEYNPTLESHYNGGDIPGITAQLDYIQNLGATSIWLTPPVANQWWSKDSSYSGYHGYWARDFKKVDEHYGTLEDYKDLSKALHARGMYLIQDIVVNHTGIFFGYEGEYDPNDTAKNFVLFEQGEQSAPEQAPFHMVDRNNPEHAQAGIYNWTPLASDYQSLEQQFTYQLGNLSDLNTKNPQVLDAFKDTYNYWIEEVGVDAYRIDTVKYVEHEFWHQFLHDDDGIYAKAKSLGKDHFLTFGEIFDSSPAFSNSGEKKVASFLGTKDKPELNSVIGFPLYFEIGNVLGEGKPSKQLAYRLERHMDSYPDPFVIPNFIDNHDTKRFLAGASQDAMKQALALLFTIPGIPIIYQGTEQAMTETRQAMFAGGYLSESSQFDQESEFYKLIQSLAALRSSDKLFSRGDLQVLASDESGPGILAYKRQYQGRSAIVLLNTADNTILLNGLRSGYSPGTQLKVLFGDTGLAVPGISSNGALSMELPARSILVITDSGSVNAEVSAENDDVVINFDERIDGEEFTRDIQLNGEITQANAKLKLILNGNLDKAIAFNSDAQGKWQVTLPVRNLGVTKYSAEVYAPEFGVVTDRQFFSTRVDMPELSAKVKDPNDDAVGFDGKYLPPKQSASNGQMEILAAKAEAAGANLRITLDMKNVTDVWAPANGFDNVSFTTFFDLPETVGTKVLPIVNARMPGSLHWVMAHVAYGWGNYMYRSNNASVHEAGDKIGVSPTIDVDKENNRIVFTYRGDLIGVERWNEAKIYITTWDISGEGVYRDISPSGGEWQFAGADREAPMVLDSVFLELNNTY
ncbi:MAG: alpha-amylase [Alteromonadaceae bacterium]|nr:alpha-amylase [Alteromonadaceae bacterium]